MDKRDFDEQVRESMNSLKVTYDEMSWERLQQKMSADPELGEASVAPDENSDFDATIKNKLHDYQRQYKSAHWKLMSEKIKMEFSWTTKVRRYRLIEITLLLLALLTLLPFLPSRFPFGKTQNTPSTPIQEPLRPSEKTHPATQASIAPTTSTTSAQATASSQRSELGAVGYAPPASLNPIQLRRSAPTGLTEPVLSINPVPADIFSVGKQRLPSAVPKTTDMLRLQLLSHTGTGLLSTKPLLATGKTSFLRFSVFSKIDFNHIKTPKDKIFQLEEYSRYSTGYGGGFSIGVDFGKWEIETGGTYSSKSYRPRYYSELIKLGTSNSYTFTRFDNIQLNMLEVPLNLRYAFAKTGKWSLYAQSGASLHLAMQAAYDRYPVVYGRMQSQTVEGQTPKIERKKYPDGLFEGGNFEENSYFTLNMGIGAERLISTRWSVFVQPGLHLYLLPGYNNGLGPNQDRISTVTISTGARISLW